MSNKWGAVHSWKLKNRLFKYIDVLHHETNEGKIKNEFGTVPNSFYPSCLIEVTVSNFKESLQFWGFLIFYYGVSVKSSSLEDCLSVAGLLESSVGAGTLMYNLPAAF